MIITKKPGQNVSKVPSNPNDPRRDSKVGTLPKWLTLAALTASPAIASAALTSVDGGLGVYDSTDNVTWTSNANLFASQYSAVATIIADANDANDGGGLSSGLVSPTDFTSTGQMTWAGANAWVNYLNAIDYGGSNQWALPTTLNSTYSAGYPSVEIGFPAQYSSQMAGLFYGGLGQVAGSDIATTHNTSYALFNNIQSAYYWSGTPALPDTDVAWSFFTRNGGQDINGEINDFFALAASPGEVNPVPLPASAWLFLSGLVGAGAMANKRPRRGSRQAVSMPV